jgi:large subunit ribosomal protein L22
MGKTKRERVLSNSEAMAYAKFIRTSPQKLNLVAQLIRGCSAAEALIQLSFNARRVSGDVRKVLQSAVANAENNHQLDVDRLYVKEATVGKTLVMKRIRPRARGRAGRILKPMSNLTVVVREREESE